MHLNVEIKAVCADPEKIRSILLESGADYRGRDTQVDSYFNIPHGRLKLREGNIENSLIFYNRENQSGPKASEVTMTVLSPGSNIGGVLAQALGTKVVVTKHREIYFIGNVKFHLDDVPGLGHFVEIEAIDLDGTLGQALLDVQCKDYMVKFGIRDADLLQESYRDMLITLI